jgi:hypothetical protein
MILSGSVRPRYKFYAAISSRADSTPVAPGLNRAVRQHSVVSLIPAIVVNRRGNHHSELRVVPSDQIDQNTGEGKQADGYYCQGVLV